MMTTNSSTRILLAVLLNPPGATTGVRTRNAVRAAAEVLGFDSTEIVNLTSTPTQTVLELNHGGMRGWLEARVDLAAGLRRADGLLGGWGITGLLGDARSARASQVEWLVDQARSCGFTQMWTVGGLPRHPSRWHQYVADKYGRTSGGPFVERLSQVLVATPLGGEACTQAVSSGADIPPCDSQSRGEAMPARLRR